MIDSRPQVTSGRVTRRAAGVEGDFIGEPAHHGGMDKAVYAYAGEDAARWEREWGLLPRLPLAPELPDRVREKARRRLAEAEP